MNINFIYRVFCSVCIKGNMIVTL